MIKTTSIQYRYPGSEALFFPDIEFERGERGLIIGPSGSGKTTLLHLLGGLMKPTDGVLEIDGTSIHQLKGRELDRFRSEHIGIIFQKPHFVQALNIRDNILLSSTFSGVKADMQWLDYMLEALKIEHKAFDKPTELSEGEKQRAAIARALMNRPSVVLADEPTSSLDDQNTEEVISLLKKQASEANASLLIVTHDNRLTSEFSNQIKLA